MKTLFSILFPLVLMGLSLLHRYIVGAKFPETGIIILDYIFSAVCIALVIFDEDELDVLRIVLFILGILTLLVSLIVEKKAIVTPYWAVTLKSSTVIFMGGFLACYVKLVILDVMEQFKNRHI